VRYSWLLRRRELLGQDREILFRDLRSSSVMASPLTMAGASAHPRPRTGKGSQRQQGDATEHRGRKARRLAEDFSSGVSLTFVDRTVVRTGTVWSARTLAARRGNLQPRGCRFLQSHVEMTMISCGFPITLQLWRRSRQLGADAGFAPELSGLVWS